MGELKMMKKAAALGKASVKSGTAKAIRPRTVEDRLSAIENMLASIVEINSKNVLAADKPDTNLNAYVGMPRNKDGIPLNISLLGSSKFGPRILYVSEDGYYLGNELYASLSAAAEAASGIVRKSGWVFWKLPNGKSIKETFKTIR